MRRERLEGEELETVLTAVTAALVRDLSPDRIVLFGSFARGDQNRASDLELVVIAQRMVAEGSSFAALVLREGRILYERRPQSRRGAPLARAGAA